MYAGMFTSNEELEEQRCRHVAYVDGMLSDAKKNTREKTVREGVDHCLVLAHMRLRLSSNEEKLSPGKKDACVAGERSRRGPCEELTIKH